MVATTSSKDRRVRVLVIDDEESNRTFAETALAEAGYEVMSASSGPVALINGRTITTKDKTTDRTWWHATAVPEAYGEG